MSTIIAFLLTSSLLQGGAALDSIATEAVANTPVSRVWEAFTMKAGMESWMVANGDIDPRVGGKMRLGYSNDAESQKIRAFFDVGNKATLDALVKRFARR